MFVVNIISKTRGTTYSEVALNRFPIVYINDDVANADGLFEDEEFKRILMRYVRNNVVYNGAKVCVRSVVEDEEWHCIDTEYILKEKISEKEYGEFVKSDMGDGR